MSNGAHTPAYTQPDRYRRHTPGCTPEAVAFQSASKGASKAEKRDQAVPMADQGVPRCGHAVPRGGQEGRMQSTEKREIPPSFGETILRFYYIYSGSYGIR